MVSYVCTGCMYESDRLYNVIRHEQRIHFNKRLRVCCGKKLVTKGDYYAHCARFHPWRRLNAVTTIHKYKICGELKSMSSGKLCQVTVTRGSPKPRRTRSIRRSKQNPEAELQIEKRSSERLRNKQQRKPDFEAESGRVEESMQADSECDIEDVPLIKFLSGSERRAYLKKYSSGGVAERREMAGIAIPVEENTEKAVSWKDEETVEEKQPASSDPAVFIGLPPKKLLLHRFSASAGQNSAAVLRELNNNDRNQRGCEEKQTGEAAPTRSWPKNGKCQRNLNKENALPSSAVALQSVDVKFEKELNDSVVSKMHREFLSIIDFDEYRIL